MKHSISQVPITTLNTTFENKNSGKKEHKIIKNCKMASLAIFLVCSPFFYLVC